MDSLQLWTQKFNSPHPHVHIAALTSLSSHPLPSQTLEILLDGMAESVVKADKGMLLLTRKLSSNEIQLSTVIDGILKRTESGHTTSLARAGGRVLEYLVITHSAALPEASFVTRMCLKRPDCWTHIIDELHRIRKALPKTRETYTRMLEVVESTVMDAFCHSGILKQDVLWHAHVHYWLLKWVQDAAGNDPSQVLQALTLLLNVNDRLDTVATDASRKTGSLQSLLIDSCIDLDSRLGAHQKTDDRLFFALLGHVAKLYNDGVPLRASLQQLANLVQARSMDISACIATILLSTYIFLDPPIDAESVRLLLTLLSVSLQNQVLDTSTRIVLCRLALYPVLRTTKNQLFDETDVKEKSLECFEFIRGVLARGEIVTAVSWPDIAARVRHLAAVILSLTRILPRLHYEAFPLESLEFPTTRNIQLLVTASLATHHSTSVSHSALHSLSTNFPPSMSLVSLLLYHSQNSLVKTRHYILTHSLPLLTRHSDPFITALVLRTAQNLSNPVVKLMALYRLWKVYPRSFVKLRAWMGETVHKWRVSHVKNDGTVEGAIVSVLRYINLLALFSLLTI